MAAGGGGPEDYAEMIHAKISEAWQCLNTIWTKVGYDEDNFRRRQKTVVKHVSELLDDMVQEADEKLNEQQQKLDSLMLEIMQLSKDLSLEQVPELDAASGKSLLEMEGLFLEVANVLRKRKAKRMEKYENVNEKLQQICQELDEVPMTIEYEGIPADAQVAKLEQNLVHMHQEKSQRIEQLDELRRSISELFSLLEKNPKNDFELLASTLSEEINAAHPISSSGIKALSLPVLEKIKELDDSLRENLMANVQKGEEYWQKIRDLWSRLNADEEMTRAFTHVHQPISSGNWDVVYLPSVLKGLCVELERLEEEKRRNMSLFVQQVREELSELWVSKCFMTSVEERFSEPTYASLTPFVVSDFTSDLFTEELLEKHEAEVEYWRGFVDRNKAMIDLVIKRGHMFAQYKTLDQKSDDPSRLANRGGALLKEEKERKKLEKTIPKLENDLKQLCQVFEEGADEGYGMRKFLVYGRTVDEMIEQDWEQFHEEKRLRKEAKKKPEAGDAKNKTLMTTQMSAPNSSRKRPATPSSALRGMTTPVKRNKTQVVVTPGKTFQSPGASATKRPLAVLTTTSKPPSTTSSARKGHSVGMAKAKSGDIHFRVDTSNNRTKQVSKKILRRSMTKARANNSVKSQSDSSTSSSDQLQKSSISQPNLQISSLEQLNFSVVVSGQCPRIVEAVHILKAQVAQIPSKTKTTNTKDNFAMPSSTVGSRSVKKTPSKTALSRQGSSGTINVTRKPTGKEQMPPSKHSKDTVISPVASYSEFTDHLLCQSTLNSSTMAALQKSSTTGAAPTTPTKSNGMSFAPAKLPLSDNCF